MRTRSIDRKLARALSAADTLRLARLATLAAQHGWTLWLVGGPLRDLLYGRRVEDLDLAIDGDVLKIARAAERELEGRLRWHPRFSTARIGFSSGHVDLARTRTETYPAPGALPVVRTAGIAQDLARRDFSVNAMALEIQEDGVGQLLDPFNGRADLRNGTLRVLHGRSFSDDPTRAFRAARFATRFGFHLDPSTRGQLRGSIDRRDHERLSGERTARELRLSLNEERPAAVLAAIARWGLTTAWGEASDPTGVGLRFLRYANNRLERLAVNPGKRTALRLAVAFHDLPKARRERMCAELRLRRDEREMLVNAPSRSRALAARLNRARGRLAVDRICAAASPDDLVLSGLLADPRLFAKLERWWSGSRGVRLEIDGHDLRAAGVPQGPAVARGLRAARVALLAGRASSPADQLKIALRAARRT
jgi:tRNA nucleotidyltransferase (CCA-adding enzyme)